MAAVDYIGVRGLDEAAAQWDADLRPYRRRGRPRGDRHHSALVVIDFQQFFCNSSSPAFLPASAHIAPRICALVEQFRAAGSPVLFTRHALTASEDPGRMGDWWRHLVREGEPWAGLCPDLPLRPSDSVVRKARYDAFDGTCLDEQLAQSGIDTVVICGVMTHLCCESTARAAFAKGYHVWVPLDATASMDEELHLGALRALAHGFAHVATAKQITAWRGDHEAVGPCDRSETSTTSVPIVRPDGPPAPTRSARPLGTTTRLEPTDADIIVVGAGPAGLAAACQAARHGLDVLVIEADRRGGLLREADWVENYPGFVPQTGDALCERLTRWADAAAVRVVTGQAEGLAVDENGIEVRLQSADEGALLRLRSRAVVVATGTQAGRAGFAGEPELAGAGVFYEASRLRTAWGSRPAGRAIIIGGGDAAFDQGVGLLRGGWRVQLMVRAAMPRALPLLQRRFAGLGGECALGTVVSAIQDEGRGLVLHWRRPGSRGPADVEEGTSRADSVLVAVGRSPRRLPLDDRRRNQSTPPPLVWAGDVRRGRARQCAIAVGDGVAAAMKLAAELAATPASRTPPTASRATED